MATVPTTVPINHKGIRPVVPVLDIIENKKIVSEKSRMFHLFCFIFLLFCFRYFLFKNNKD